MSRPENLAAVLRSDRSTEATIDGVSALIKANDIRVMNVQIDDDTLTVSSMDGRAISVPIAWFPRLANGTPAQRQNWQISGAGYGLHWPELDEDLSTEGLLRGIKGVSS